jgi:hypothetical protein
MVNLPQLPPQSLRFSPAIGPKQPENAHFLGANATEKACQFALNGA